MVCSQSLIGLVEHNLTLLADTLVTNINNYFFTEKELHAHFYYLAMKSGAFQHRGHHLLHAEYPVEAIHQDIAKLRLLRQFGEDLLNRVHFVERTKVAIFIGEDMQKAGAVIRREMARYDPSEYYIVTRE